MGRSNGVSSKVHLRSPVRSFPCLWFTSWLGSPLGFCLSLSTPPLPAAQREVGTGVGHSPELESTRLLLLVSERLRVAPWVPLTPASRHAAPAACSRALTRAIPCRGVRAGRVRNGRFPFAIIGDSLRRPIRVCRLLLAPFITDPHIHDHSVRTVG